MTTATADTATTKTLSLTEDLILMLLNEESGFFYQVPGWALNCTLAGAAIAQLSLMSRLDSDPDSLILLDNTPTGDPSSTQSCKRSPANPSRTTSSTGSSASPHAPKPSSTDASSTWSTSKSSATTPASSGPSRQTWASSTST